jgi:hypothetical protein
MLAMAKFPSNGNHTIFTKGNNGLSGAVIVAETKLHLHPAYWGHLQ